MTFIFTGILPLALLLFLIGTPQRRRNNLAKSQGDSNLNGAQPSDVNEQVAEVKQSGIEETKLADGSHQRGNSA